MSCRGTPWGGVPRDVTRRCSHTDGVTRQLLLVAFALLVLSACSGSGDSLASLERVPEPTAQLQVSDGEEVQTEPTPERSQTTPVPTKIRVEEPSGPDAEGLLPLGGPAPGSGDIRDVDFFNDFVYPVSFGEELAVTVTDGEYIDEPGYLWFSVFEVEYGDLDDDGTDEAVVQTGFNTGGTGQFGRLAVWDIVDGRIVERGWVGTGDRADGGLWHYELRDATIVTENFLTDQGACCPNMLTQQRLALVSDGLVTVESIEPLRWMALNSYDDANRELEFLAGTSAAILKLSSADETNELAFEAAADQWVTITRRRGPSSAIALFDEAGALVAESAGADLVVQLGSSGRFTLVFTNDTGGEASTVVDIAITANPLPAISFTPSVRELVVDEEPLVRLLAMQPTFDLSDGGRLNAEIDAWMGDQTDWWVADVIEFPPLERDGNDSSIGGEYELLYDVTMVTDEIVSFRWNWYEYVCCRPYPNYGHQSLVVDLVQRRIVPVDEIVDLGRLDAIHDIWIAQAAAEEILPADFLDWSGGDGPGFSSLALTPIGVEFGTDRQGAIGATTTVVPYEALDDLVNQDLVARARAGAQPIRLADAGG